MKMKTLIARAYEIISEEAENVYDEFKEDDGTITAENHAAAVRLQSRMENWLTAAERCLPTPKANLKPKKKAPRGVVQKKQHRIVVEKRSALE